MSSSCCDNDTKFDGASVPYRRALIAVIAINALMTLVEFAAGIQAQSQALQADALDFLADTLTYSISLYVIGSSVSVRARAALGKAALLLVCGCWVLGATIYRLFGDTVPDAQVMGTVGAVALAANLASVLILLRYRDGDANVRSVWLCSRNDAIGNIAVIVAAAGVWGTASIWPDLVVAALMASLFVGGALSIYRQALGELRSPSMPLDFVSENRHVTY